MKWMYAVIFILFFFFFNFFSWRGRSRSLIWNVRVKFATKTLLPWENGHLLPLKSRAWMRNECVRRADRTVDTIPFLVLLKSVLIFHRQGFYCTDSIHENSDWRSYFSSTNVRDRAQRTEARASRRQRCGLEASPLVGVGLSTGCWWSVPSSRSDGAFCFFCLFFFFVTLGDASPKAGLARRHYSGSIGRCKIHSKALPLKFPWCCHSFLLLFL